jgi:hypothetical protein
MSGAGRRTWTPTAALSGLRGGGGNFGITAPLEFEMHPLDTTLAGVKAHSEDPETAPRLGQGIRALAFDDASPFASGSWFSDTDGGHSSGVRVTRRARL